ncbi:MAG: hypothetical protein IJ858_07400 [Acidaminococcaceae bacterium]|nr:hypothetical protein [Acidaminococcaceae bacterium]
MYLTVNAKNAAALLPNPAGLQQVAAAEKFVSVKKFHNVNEAFIHVAKRYEKLNYVPDGRGFWFPTLAEMETNPWYRDGYHDNTTVVGQRFFVVISEEEGHVGIFTRLDMLASVFVDAPCGTEAFEVPDLAAAVARIQMHVAENILPFSGYFPTEKFRMVRNLPMNQMVTLPYLAFMQAHCILPSGLQTFSVYGYAEPQLMPSGKQDPFSDSGRITPITIEGGDKNG